MSGLTAQIGTLSLVGEAQVDAKGRVYETCDTVLGDRCELLHVLVVERDELAVLVDAAGCDRLGNDGGVACDCLWLGYLSTT